MIYKKNVTKHIQELCVMIILQVTFINFKISEKYSYL